MVGEEDPSKYSHIDPTLKEHQMIDVTEQP